MKKISIIIVMLFCSISAYSQYLGGSADGYSGLEGTFVNLSGVVLLTPANFSQCNQTILNFSWDAVANATGYNLQVSEMVDFSTTLLNETLTATSISNTTPFNSGKLYYWRVRAAISETNLPWSSAWSFSTSPAGTAYSISGTVKCSDAALTPLSGTVLILKDELGNSYSSAITNVNGEYSFQCVSNGSYVIQATSFKAWGGLNVEDAILTKRAIINAISFTDLQMKAADVNLNNSVNVVDAILMQRKIINTPTPQWIAPNYVFENPIINVNGANIEQNILGLCAGDVNGSYTPPQ